MRTITALMLTLTLSSCAIYHPQNVQGKRFDANTSFCRQLLDDSRRFYRIPDYSGIVSDNTMNAQIGFTEVSDLERREALSDYEKECETQSGYNERKKFDLFKHQTGQ